MSGTKYSPTASMIGTANRNIMFVPCTVKSWLYWSGPTTPFSGRQSWVRMTSALTPPSAKNTRHVTM
jgi:hypothetical protein